MINVKCVFSTLNLKNGAMNWYFHAREGKIGPFMSYGEAVNKMHALIQKAIKTGDRGGRSASESELPSQQSMINKNTWR
jgi:hypothetical protein